MNSPFANVSIQHSVADANGRGSITWTRVNGKGSLFSALSFAV